MKMNNELMTGKNNALVSIIVPVYNAEQYLFKCLNSIVNQTYKNLEIIIVNDGSTDGSDEICRYFEKTDQRIRYVIQENKGVSAARNQGMDLCHGKYIMFVDSDDYVSENIVERLMGHSSPDSLSVCTFDCFGKEGKIGQSYHQYDQNSYESRVNYLSSVHQDWSPFAKLYGCDLVKSIRFEEHYKLAEDLFFNVNVICKNPNFKVHAINEALYHYRVDDQSSSHIKFKDEREFSGVQAEVAAYELLRKNHLEAQNSRIIFNGILLYCSRYASLARNEKKAHVDEMRYVRSVIRKYKQHLLQKKDKTKAEKMKMDLIVYFPHLFTALHELSKK